MRKLCAIAITLFALSCFSAAQAAGSDEGAEKKTHHKHGGTLVGCLSGPNSEGVYVLKHGKKEVEVGGSDELSKHVGHKVKLHGMWVKSGAEIGEKTEAAGSKEANEEKGEHHFKVSSIDHVAETCTEGGGMGHHHKKGSDTASTTPK